MQYIAAPANSWSDVASPEMFFFDAVQDNIDLTSLVDDNDLSQTLRNARTTLGKDRKTMVVAGQNANTFYLTELAKAWQYPANVLDSLAVMSRAYVNNVWSYHASSASLIGVPSTNQYQIVTLTPARLTGNKPAWFPQLGVRSGIGASRSYVISLTLNYRTTTNVTGTLVSTGTYTPPSSPSGGTTAYGENNYVQIGTNYSHLSWQRALTISDTGYGPTLLVPSATSVQTRGLRVNQAIIPNTETVDLSIACVNYTGKMLRLHKGQDYEVADDCQPGNLYPIDFILSQKTIML